MQVLTGIVLLLKFVLAGIVGTRLLRFPSERWLSPERCLGWFFLTGNLAGGMLMIAAYASWASQGQPESTGTVNQLHAAGQICISFGYTMVLLFTQRTFYPDSKAALMTTWWVIGILVASLLGRALFEGWAISLEPGVMHWTGFYCRAFAMVAASWATFGYWLQMKRRSRLGLADPLVANRFMLWGLWAAGNMLTAFAEPVARFFYGWLTGAEATAAQSIQQVGGSLITITLCITSLLALTTTTILFLAFFPTDRYRNWIATRAESQRA